MTTSPRAVLIIGASGRLGLHFLRQLAKHSSRPQVHAFCRDPSKLKQNDTGLCTLVIRGNARRAHEIENALAESRADVVILSIGNGDCVAKTDIRSASAKAMVSVLQKPAFRHVQVYVISSSGAADSPIVAGCDAGEVLLGQHLCHVLRDHTEQEASFASIKDRRVIVRPTALTEHMATGSVEQFSKNHESLCVHVDRKDIAKWVVEDMYSAATSYGHIVNITGTSYYGPEGLEQPPTIH